MTIDIWVLQMVLLFHIYTDIELVVSTPYGDITGLVWVHLFEQQEIISHPTQIPFSMGLMIPCQVKINWLLVERKLYQ